MRFARIRAYIFPVAVAALLMGWCLNERGVYIYDEAHFLLAARTMEDGVRGLLAGQPMSALKSDILRTGGTLYFAAKPGHIALLALIGLATGGLTAFKGVLLSVTAGIGIVLLTQSITVKRCGDITGLIAGVFAALTPLMIASSRSALGLSTSVFFTLLAGRLLMMSARRDVLVGVSSGIAAFMAFSCHYNSIVLMAAITAGLWPSIAKRRRYIMAGGFIACVMLSEAFTQLAAYFIRPVYTGYRTFLGELIYNFMSYQAAPFSPARSSVTEEFFPDGAHGYGIDAWLYLLSSWWHGFGILLPLAIVGTISMVKGRGVSHSGGRLFLWWGWMPFVFWSLYPWKVERSFMGVAPGLAAIAATAASSWLTGNHRIFTNQSEQTLMFPARLRPGIMRTLSWIMIMSLYFNILIIQQSLKNDRSPFALVVSRAPEYIRALPANSITGWSAGWRSLPQWKWYLGPEFRQRYGAYPPAIDFSLRQSPGVLCIDMLTSSSQARQHIGDGFSMLPHKTMIQAATHRGWAELAIADMSFPPE
ncbi:MAG: hypothetical protein WCK47_02590 [bacterium]|nr:hypothetical protein [Candidatus Sumerlaeota bacterium]